MSKHDSNDGATKTNKQYVQYMSDKLETSSVNKRYKKNNYRAKYNHRDHYNSRHAPRQYHHDPYRKGEKFDHSYTWNTTNYEKRFRKNESEPSGQDFIPKKDIPGILMNQQQKNSRFNKPYKRNYCEANRGTDTFNDNKHLGDQKKSIFNKVSLANIKTTSSPFISSGIKESYAAFAYGNTQSNSAPGKSTSSTSADHSSNFTIVSQSTGPSFEKQLSTSIHKSSPSNSSHRPSTLRSVVQFNNLKAPRHSITPKSCQKQPKQMIDTSLKSKELSTSPKVTLNRPFKPQPMTFVKGNLSMLINGPRSHKERMQVAKILQNQRSKVRINSRPKLDLFVNSSGAISPDLNNKTIQSGTIEENVITVKVWNYKNIDFY